MKVWQQNSPDDPVKVGKTTETELDGGSNGFVVGTIIPRYSQPAFQLDIVPDACTRQSLIVRFNPDPSGGHDDATNGGLRPASF